MEKKSNRSIFRVLLIPLLSVLAGELLLMTGMVLFGGTFDRLIQNEKDILQKQVENRGNYLLSEMHGNWSELDLLAEDINAYIEKKLSEGQISIDGLSTNSEDYMAVLNEITTELIDTMYNKKVSGAFVIFHTNASEMQESLPGVYLRDLDPKAAPSEKKEDILVHRAPRGVVQAGNFATDRSWQPMFSPEDSYEKSFFSKPYYAACADVRKEPLNASDYGYWTYESYCLSGDNHLAISYSVPLILDDGTVYGVLGIELLQEYLETLLPSKELQDDEYGSYMLAVAKKSSQELTPVVLSGDMLSANLDALDSFVLSEDAVSAKDGNGEHYAAVKPLVLYNNNTPFEDEVWYLLGSVPKQQLFAFSNHLIRNLLISVAVTMLVGVLGILLVSYRISRPVRKLSEEVGKSQSDNQIPILSSVRIFEIDQLVNAVTRLGREVLESSTRFLSIMDMASVELAGYEIKEDSDNIYVTENYFKLLGMDDVEIDKLTTKDFLMLQERAGKVLKHSVAEDGSVLYAVPLPDGQVRYLRSEQKRVENRRIGLIEDVTASVLEKKQIEHERDYDALTKLLSRQGFKRKAEKLFEDKEKMKIAAVLMMDLDHLKIINDKFGHDVGDLYIQKAGECFRDNVPPSTLCSRISGDEFLMLFYGYEDKEEIWKHVQYLYQKIRSLEFVLPDGVDSGISASGGLVWYPKDSQNLSEMMKYSDFAMYCVKKQERGNISEFDLTAYQAMLLRHQCRQEFYQLIERQRLDYHFQPIFDGRTGNVYAYEALMRVNMPNLRSPLQVLQIAKETERMQDIETLTMFGATEAYQKLLEEKKVCKDALLFINSIANISMTDENDRRYHQMYHKLQSQLVVEITEAENLDMELVRKKRNVEGFSGMLALDDYGSGYNTEINLLELEPQFIKVDITIVRNIHEDPNKQQLVKNIVEYAHSRDMMVIAEGLEYAEEVQKSLELGVDLLQGYFLARPAAVPSAIADEAKHVIENFWLHLF